MDELLVDPAGLYIVGYHDPAGTKVNARLKKVGSRAAFIVIGADPLRRIFVLHASAGRMPVPEMRDRIFELHEHWGTKAFGVEANAMQSLYAESLWTMAREQGLRVPIVPVQQSTRVDKDFRIRSIMRPVMARGQLFTHKSMIELNHEIESFPNSFQKDMVDALSAAISMIPPPMPTREVDEQREARLEWLRSRGAPAYYIEQVARGEV